MGIKLAFHNTVYKKFFEQMSQHKHLKMAFRPITDHQTPRKASIADSCHILGNHTKYISFTTLIVVYPLMTCTLPSVVGLAMPD